MKTLLTTLFTAFVFALSAVAIKAEEHPHKHEEPQHRAEGDQKKHEDHVDHEEENSELHTDHVHDETEVNAEGDK